MSRTGRLAILTATILLLAAGCTSPEKVDDLPPNTTAAPTTEKPDVLIDYQATTPCSSETGTCTATVRVGTNGEWVYESDDAAALRGGTAGDEELAAIVDAVNAVDFDAINESGDVACAAGEATRMLIMHRDGDTVAATVCGDTEPTDPQVAAAMSVAEGLAYAAE